MAVRDHKAISSYLVPLDSFAELDQRMKMVQSLNANLLQALTATADYLEALGDALTLMPPEMRDPRDVADEIREMLS